LGGNGKIDELLRWTVSDDPVEEYFTLVAMRPRFAEAALVLSRNMQTQAEIDPAFNDAGRVVAGCWVMSLHLTSPEALPCRG
jgi:hypothetical protein